MLNDDPHHRPTDHACQALPATERARIEIEALGLLLRHMRTSARDAEVRVLLPLMFWHVRSGTELPADGRLVATEDELQEALRSLVCALLAATVPVAGLDPQVNDDAHWALGLLGLSMAVLAPDGRRPDPDEALRRIDEHVARLIDELVAAADEPDDGPQPLRLLPPLRPPSARSRRAGRTGGRRQRPAW